MKRTDLLTTSAVAEQFMVSSSTVVRWVKDGKLTPAITTPGGHFRFRRSDLDAFITEPTEVTA